MWWQQNWHGGKVIHDIGQEGDLHAGEPSEQDRNLDTVKVKYMNILNILKYITIFLIEII